jgi:hypothetical protein
MHDKAHPTQGGGTCARRELPALDGRRRRHKGPAGQCCAGLSRHFHGDSTHVTEPIFGLALPGTPPGLRRRPGAGSRRPGQQLPTAEPGAAAGLQHAVLDGHVHQQRGRCGRLRQQRQLPGGRHLAGACGRHFTQRRPAQRHARHPQWHHGHQRQRRDGGQLRRCLGHRGHVQQRRWLAADALARHSLHLLRAGGRHQQRRRGRGRLVPAGPQQPDPLHTQRAGQLRGRFAGRWPGWRGGHQHGWPDRRHRAGQWQQRNQPGRAVAAGQEPHPAGCAGRHAATPRGRPT